MEPEVENLNVLMDSLDLKRQNSLVVTGFLLQNVKIKEPSDIDILNRLVIMIHEGIKDGLISKYDRTRIFEKLLIQKYISISIFEKALNQLFEETVNRNIMGEVGNNVPPQENDLSQKYILQLLKKQEEQKLIKEKENADSQMLIKQLQLKEQLSNKKRVEAASKVDLKMQCPICLEQIHLSELALLACQHSFHRKCVFEHFNQMIFEKKFPLTCPDCQIECYYADVSQYLSEALLEKYQKIGFEYYVSMHHEDMSWCPTAGCQYVFSYDNDQTQFFCLSCRKTYCLQCKVLFHNGMTCKQFNLNRVFDKNDEKFIEFVKGAKYKQCPNCMFWVQKNQGCDHMTCRCSYEFCYVCGGQYMNCECMQKRDELNIDFNQIIRPARVIPSTLSRSHQQRPRKKKR